MVEKTILIAAANFMHTFPSQILLKIQGALQPGHELVQISTTGIHEGEREKLLGNLERVRPRALIGIAIRLEKDVIDAFTATGAPVILIDEEAPGASTVTTDNYAGGYMAGCHLAKTKKKNIALVTGRIRVDGGYNAMQRANGFIKALDENRIKLPEQNLYEVISYSYSEGAEAMTRMLGGKPLPDAVFCSAGDMCAMGMLKAAREAGVRVPDDIAIIGYDDQDMARTAKPPLTTIKQPIDQMALKAYEMAAYLTKDVFAKPQKVVFKPELIQRMSA
ncbi:MAG: substrate-binding domain-containing protein [Spirochaetia bacterium]|nr:substrate-binding domain-containing protein [Spirochaetia bacterium]